MHHECCVQLRNHYDHDFGSFFQIRFPSINTEFSSSNTVCHLPLVGKILSISVTAYAKVSGVTLRDINEIMPKIPNMKWGALTNVRPTPSKVTEMDKIFPTNGKWHTVFEEENSVFIDGKRIWKKDPKSWS